VDWHLLTAMAAETFIAASMLAGVITLDWIRDRNRRRRDDPWG
jgi:hypothetical protein